MNGNVVNVYGRWIAAAFAVEIGCGAGDSAAVVAACGDCSICCVGRANDWSLSLVNVGGVHSWLGAVEAVAAVTDTMTG